MLIILILVIIYLIVKGIAKNSERKINQRPSKFRKRRFKN